MIMLFKENSLGIGLVFCNNHLWCPRNSRPESKSRATR